LVVLRLKVLALSQIKLVAVFELIEDIYVHE